MSTLNISLPGLAQLASNSSPTSSPSSSLHSSYYPSTTTCAVDAVMSNPGGRILPMPASSLRTSSIFTSSPRNSSRRPPTAGLTCTSHRVLNQHQQFVLFVKILFMFLEASQNKKLLLRAKTIVALCTRRNREGDPNYRPLQYAVERCLRRTVGELYWARATEYFRDFSQRKGLVSSRTSTINSGQVTL